jgi:hypothetical protein
VPRGDLTEVRVLAAVPFVVLAEATEVPPQRPVHGERQGPEHLKIIDREVPQGLQVHLILDNYATHKHPNVQVWLEKHPRFHLHFTPTSSSWPNLVERWFRELTEKAPLRGVFHSVPDLIASIEAYLDAHNDDPKPFVWTATADDILAKVARGRVALQAATQNLRHTTRTRLRSNMRTMER